MVSATVIRALSCWRVPASLLSAMALLGCMGMPDGVEPVQNFSAERYLGRWYEIARLDHSFERGLTDVTAEYSWRDDGSVRVINRGFDTEEGEWSDIEGKAKFAREEDEGYLKVSFFGPFYASYVVFGLDQDGYDHAFVSGFNDDYLWLLARKPVVSEAVREEFLERASTLGFDTDALIWVEHGKTDVSRDEATQ